MATPLEIAVDIDRIVRAAQALRQPLDVSESAEDLVVRFPDCGFSPCQIRDTLKEEAGAAGLALI